MEWMNDGFWGIVGVLFGTGGILYAVIMHFVEKRKYNAEVKEQQANADIKSDEFWKNRYDVLNSEMQNKDAWWKERYDNLYEEFQNERKLSNEIVSSFRQELNEIRDDYDRQHEIDRRKYGELLEQYNKFREESDKQNAENIKRINQLEKLVADYEKRLSIKKPIKSNKDE